MAKKVKKTFTATLALNPEKAGAWLAYVNLSTPAEDAGINSIGNVAESISDQADRKSTRLNSSHIPLSRMPSSA